MKKKTSSGAVTAVPTSAELFDAILKLNRSIKRCAAISDPGSFGRGRGKILKTIAGLNGCTARELADYLDIRPPSLTSRLKPLEADHLIEKKRDPDDARIVRIYITDLGRDALKKRKNSKKNAEVDYCDSLSDEEKAQLIEYCNRLSAGLTRHREEYDRKLKEAIANIKIS